MLIFLLSLTAALSMVSILHVKQITLLCSIACSVVNVSMLLGIAIVVAKFASRMRTSWVRVREDTAIILCVGVVS